jgi:hypothetical protein
MVLSFSVLNSSNPIIQLKNSDGNYKTYDSILEFHTFHSN